MSGEDPILTLARLLQLIKTAESSSKKKVVQQKLGDYVMVAAIDFGTTFSGYAFSFKTKKQDVRMNKNWGAGAGFTSYKTPTCVLLDPDGRFQAFGYEAQQKYSDLLEKDDQKYSFFDRFKMTLHNNKNLGKSTMISATNGKSHSALDIFSMSLKYLKDHLIGMVSQQMEGAVANHLIRWVVTVPAIWSDASKQFMREAALKAGLIDQIDSSQFLIALEPEAASLFCRQLEINKFVERTKASNVKLETGAKYLVIDAGGGTLDVTAHQLLAEGKVKELHYATGGALGGTRVDEKFTKLMEDIFGGSFITKYRKQCASQWLAVMADFEKKKRSMKVGEETSSTNMQLLWGFGTAFAEAHNGKSVESAFKEYKGRGVHFNSGMICLSYDVMVTLFKDVIDGIIRHVKELLQIPNLKDVKYFFLVGGFSESTMIQEAICSNFGGRIKVMIPEESSLAVLKGAVFFGHNPGVISSRVSAKTYGVETMQDFDASKHAQDKKLVIEGRQKCQSIFRIFIEAGAEVEDGDTKTVTFCPAREGQDAADVEIYSSDNPNVKYTTDDDADAHGKISVKWPGHGLDRQLEVSMTFGGTEIHVEAVSQPGNNKAQTKLDFFTK